MSTASPTLDPRIRRTRQALQDALRQLLTEKSFEDILVADVTQAAAVNRATFYDHYADKHALFNALVAGDFEQLLAHRQIEFHDACTAAMAAIMLATYDFLARLHGENSGCSRQVSGGALIDAAMTLAIRDILFAGMPKPPQRLPREVVAAALAGAAYGAIKEWFFTRHRQPTRAELQHLVELVHPKTSA
jgi:AcrR family transcriptional regulator